MAAARVDWGKLGGWETINAPYDYSQWERKRGGVAAEQKPDVLAPPWGESRFKPSPLLKSYCAASKRTLRARASATDGEPTAIRLLRMHIQSKKEAVAEYRKCKDHLLTKNLSLITSIQEVDHNTHLLVHSLLERYQQFKGAIGALKEMSSREQERKRAELDDTQTRLQDDIERLQEEVDETTESVRQKSSELQVLLHYKEKEYPVKAARMEHLKEQIHELRAIHKADLVEFEEMVAEERDKCDQRLHRAKLKVETMATELSMSAMLRSVQEKAINNKLMEREIVILRGKLQGTQEESERLKSQIRALQRTRKAMRARPLSMLLKRGKCLPETELKLDIPLQKNASF